MKLDREEVLSSLLAKQQELEDEIVVEKKRAYKKEVENAKEAVAEANDHLKELLKKVPEDKAPYGIKDKVERLEQTRRYISVLSMAKDETVEIKGLNDLLGLL